MIMLVQYKLSKANERRVDDLGIVRVSGPDRVWDKNEYNSI